MDGTHRLLANGKRGILPTIRLSLCRRRNPSVANMADKNKLFACSFVLSDVRLRRWFGRLALWLLASMSSLAYPQSPSSPLAELFQSANKSFARGDFGAAREAYRQTSSLCQGSELGLQCEYFAALCDWNLNPCQEHANVLQTWLENAKQFEDRLAERNSKAVSQSWSHWVESAHLIIAKWDASQGHFEKSKRRLKQLLSPSPSPAPSAVDETFNRVSWPSVPCQSPQLYADLADLTSRDVSELEEALYYYDQAAKVCGDHPELNLQIYYGKALSCSKLSRWPESLACLDRLNTFELSNDLKIKSKLLEIQARKNLGQVIDIGREIKPLVDLSLMGNPEAQTLYDLSLSLLEAGLQEESDKVFQDLVHKFPHSPISLEARIRMAYGAAKKLDWVRVKELTSEALRLGCPESWDGYAQYLHGRSLLETGDLTGGIGVLEAVLKSQTSSTDIQISAHLDLADALYRHESWPAMQPLVEWLLQQAKRSVQKPSWLPQAMLWQAELLANQQKWNEAEEVVFTLRRDFSAWNRLAEVDYLLARCRISRADFDGARELLDQLINDHPNGTIPISLAARSAWMKGETLMMQRRYAEAGQAYEQAMQYPGETYWVAASKLQRGLCAEQMQQFQEAARWYEQVLVDHANSPFAESARTRRAVLTTPSKQQVERIGSGTKR